MAVTRLDLAVAAAVAAALLWIEHDHRIIIGTPAAAEAVPQANSACPDTDDVPFSAECIRFIGGVVPDVAARPGAAARRTATEPSGRAASHDPPCPASNENAPYSAQCIRFLSGWYWRADPPGDRP